MLGLRRCPFCGSKDLRIDDVSEAWWDSGVQYGVCCSDCYAVGPYKDTEIQAGDAWNQRHNASL